MEGERGPGAAAPTSHHCRCIPQDVRDPLSPWHEPGPVLAVPCGARLPSAPHGSEVRMAVVLGTVPAPPQLPCVTVPTCPPVLVIPNLISTNFIFTFRLWMKMLNIIIR